MDNYLREAAGACVSGSVSEAAANHPVILQVIRLGSQRRLNRTRHRITLQRGGRYQRCSPIPRKVCDRTDLFRRLRTVLIRPHSSSDALSPDTTPALPPAKKVY